MKEKTLHLLSSIFSIVTGLVTLANFLFSLKVGFSPNLSIAAVQPVVILPFRIVMFILLETALAYAFGKSLILTERQGSGIPFIMLFVISLLSAWTSLFNAQWIIVGPVPEGFQFLSSYTVKFFLLSAIAAAIAIYLIWEHFRRLFPLTQSINKKEPDSAGIQGICFAVTFFMFLYG